MADTEKPIGYMERTRHYYRALGYTRDYVWATFDEVPFVRPSKPLSQLRVALITTASPPLSNGSKQVWSGATSPPPTTLFTANVAWDKESTHTEDRESFLPIAAASALAAEGIFAGLTPRARRGATNLRVAKTPARRPAGRSPVSQAGSRRRRCTLIFCGQGVSIAPQGCGVRRVQRPGGL